MHATQILALSGIDLAKRAARLMGYAIHDSPGEITGGAPTTPYCFVDQSDNRGLLCWEPHRPLREFRPDRNHEHADQILTYVAGKHQQTDLIAALWFVIENPCDWWNIITRTPEDISRAFVLMMDH